MINFTNYIFEKIQKYEISFIYNDEQIKFISNDIAARSIYTDIINWLYEKGYTFDEDFLGRKLLSKQEIEQLKNKYRSDHFYNIPGTDKYILINVGIKQLFSYIKVMLKRFGIDENNIKIKSIGESTNQSQSTKEIKPYSQFDTNAPKQSPFKDAICILGESGAGKSVRIENTLQEEGHNFEMIVPSIATSSLLVQYNTVTRTFVLSKLGKMMKEASENPQQLYTAVFDECHKYIDIINDELLQCLSTKRNNGLRFISLDPVTEDMYNFLTTNKGRKVVPDNLGFVFISSKEDIIRENDDFRNRMIFITITEGQKELENKIHKLLSLRETEATSKYKN